MHRRIALAALAGFCAIPAAGGAQDAHAATRAAAGSLDQLHSLIVARRGQVLLEETFRGPATDVPVNVKSVSKTMVALAAGAAIDRNLMTLDTTLEEAIPNLIPRDADPRAARLTVENLVTMRAGLARTSGANYGAWVSSRDWIAYALSRPFVAEPGRRMLYSTGSFHILGAVIAARADASLLAVMRDWIGAPLDVQVPAWTRDPQGLYLGGNEMALSPRAMLRVAEMARQDGMLKGTRVLSAGWMRQSFTPRTRSPFSGLDYGYGWFLGRLAGTPMAMARGYGGQIIAVFPEDEASVIITSDPTRPARSEGYFGDLMRLMEDRILPDLRRA